MHILGATGEGKSKLLELLIRHNIDQGYGCCLLDPSDNGDTCYKVLKYAINQGFERIVLLEPHDILRTSRVPAINPLHYSAPAPAIVGGLMDACRILWGGSFSDTPRIQKYLPAVLSALHAGNYCLPDAECLMDRDDPVFNNQRQQLLYNENFLKYQRRHHAHLVSAFRNVREWDGFLPTVNRLEPFMDPTMKLLFGAREGMNFTKLITEGYLVLVNLDPEGVWGSGSPEQRLLGTIIINEITHAISRLRNSGWKGVYYLYIDEAGDYATSKLSYILDKKRKSGLRLTLSHQRFDQFGDRDVSSAVYGGTKIKVLFNTPSRDDRDKMIRMMFGGELSDREVSYHLQDTPKQNCWIKNNKQKPVKARILDLPDIDIPKPILDSFKDKIYASEFYKSVEQIRAERNKRFAVQPIQTKPSARTISPEKPDAKQSTDKDNQAPPVRTISDDIADSTGILRRKGGRATRKKTKTPPKAE